MPKNNEETIKRFRTGSGKSPSFFFFTNNSKFMLKTMKKSEVDIIIGSDIFLNEYFCFINKNPNSLISKIFGIFTIKIDDRKEVTFFVTENMVGKD